jgi:hypothetical protein
MRFSCIFCDRREGDTNQLKSRKEEDQALVLVSDKLINYKNDWIVDSGCSNRMIGDKEKFYSMEKYRSRRVMVIANNSKIQITHTLVKLS